MQCNICGNEEFLVGGNNATTTCSKCGSIVRNRLFYLYFLRQNFSHNLRVLHLAPSRCLYNVFHNYFGNGYVPADLMPQNFPWAKNMIRINLNDMEIQPSCQFDLIIHSHVLNCIYGNYVAALYHLFRCLKFDGMMMCIIPFTSDKYEEDCSDITDEERQFRFHHKTIVRRFGRENIEDSLGKVINIRDNFDPVSEFGEGILNYFNIPFHDVQGLNNNTVLFLKKSDYKLPGIY